MASSWRDLLYYERSKKNRKLEQEKQAFDVLKFQISEDYRKKSEERAAKADIRAEQRFADYEEQEQVKDVASQYAPILESLENFDITPDELEEVRDLSRSIGLQSREDDSIQVKSAYNTFGNEVDKMIGNVEEVHTVRNDFANLIQTYNKELGKPEKEGSYNPKGMQDLLVNARNKAEYWAKEGNEAALTGALQWVDTISKTHYVERELDRLGAIQNKTSSEKSVYENARRAYDSGVPTLAYQHLTGQVGLELAEQKAGMRTAKEIEDETMDRFRKTWNRSLEKTRPAEQERKAFGKYYPMIGKLQTIPTTVSGWDLVNNPRAMDTHARNMVDDILGFDAGDGDVLRSDIQYFGTGKMRDLRALAFIGGMIGRGDKAGDYVYMDGTMMMKGGKVLKNKDILEYAVEMFGESEQQRARNIEEISKRYDVDWKKDGGDKKELGNWFAGVAHAFLETQYTDAGFKFPEYSKANMSIETQESQVDAAIMQKQKLRKSKLDEVTKLIGKQESKKQKLIKQALDHVFVPKDKSLPSKKGSDMKLEDLMKTKPFKSRFSEIDLELKLLSQKLSEIKNMEVDPQKIVLPYEWDKDYTKGDEDAWWNSEDAQAALKELGLDINR